MVTRLLSYFLILQLCGCAVATYKEKPLYPAKTADEFEARTLDDAGLKKFIEANLGHEASSWPIGSWDLQMLTLAAFYYHPDLDLARAEWETVRAGIITAGERPNPSFGFSPQYNADSPGGVSPWTLGFKFDIPVETAGKRGYRSEKAGRLSDAARLRIAVAAWRVRSRLRTTLIDIFYAANQADVLRRQETILEEVARHLEQRLSAGEASLPDVTQARISLEQTRLSARDALRREAEARSRLAGALGLPGRALERVNISFDFIDRLPASVPFNDLRRQALFNRADIMASLSEYAAGQSALQLEIAKQYPDIHIGPGYTWDQGENKWSIGLSIALPVFNRNEGPIAEAEARRTESSARFAALQAAVSGEVDIGITAYRTAIERLGATDSLAAVMDKRVQSAEAMFKAGESDMPDLLGSQSEYMAVSSSRLDALTAAQRSLGMLEDAVQLPIGFGPLPPISKDREPQN